MSAKFIVNHSGAGIWVNGVFIATNVNPLTYAIINAVFKSNYYELFTTNIDSGTGIGEVYISDGDPYTPAESIQFISTAGGQIANLPYDPAIFANNHHENHYPGGYDELVKNNLDASSLKAPTATAVNNGLATKANLTHSTQHTPGGSDQVVQNSLAASTVYAPTATAVNNALAGKVSKIGDKARLYSGTYYGAFWTVTGSTFTNTPVSLVFMGIVNGKPPVTLHISKDASGSWLVYVDNPSMNGYFRTYNNSGALNIYVMGVSGALVNSKILSEATSGITVSYGSGAVSTNELAGETGTLVPVMSQTEGLVVQSGVSATYTMTSEKDLVWLRAAGGTIYLPTGVDKYHTRKARIYNLNTATLATSDGSLIYRESGTTTTSYTKTATYRCEFVYDSSTNTWYTISGNS